MRLIDADAMMARVVRKKPEVGKLRYIEGFNDALAMIRSMIHSAPTIDAVPVVHGEWVFGEIDVMGATVRCSECGWECDRVDHILWSDYSGHRFCGHCGAKMDLEEK